MLAPPSRSRTATALMIAAWLGFAVLALGVALGWTQQADEALMRDLRQFPAGLTPFFQAVTYLGDAWVRLALACAGGAALLLARRRRAAIALLVVALPAGVINTLTKQAFARPRPQVGQWLEQTSGYSFPSGHAFSAGVLYLGLALALAPLIPAGLRRPAIVAAIAIALLVALSRVWLGVHYPSDVLAGLLCAAGWTLLVFRLLRP